MKVTIKKINEIKAASQTELHAFMAIYKLAYDDEGYADDPIVHAAYDVHSRLEKVREMAHRVRQTAEQVIKRTAEESKLRFFTYSGLSSLGELQSDGPQFDIACAMYDAAYTRFCGAVEKLRAIENAAARDRVMNELPGTARAICNLLRATDSGMTAVLIAKTLELPIEPVYEIMLELSRRAMVSMTEKRNVTTYRFVSEFPVEL